MLKRLVLVVALVVATGLAWAPNAAADWNFACFAKLANTCQWRLTSFGVQPVAKNGASVKPLPAAKPDPCSYELINPQPDPGGPAWGGHDAVHGRLWVAICPSGSFNYAGSDQAQNYAEYTPTDPYFVPDGTAPNNTSTIDPSALIARANGMLSIPQPTLQFGPVTDEVAVKVPIWLWVGNADPVSETASAGGLSATVTAELASTTWQMGEPYDPATPGVEVPPVECAGAGVAFESGMDRSSPPCGYTYIWRSLPDRTDGTGSWPVTAVAHWTVTWTLSTGDSGSEDVTSTSTMPVEVREWHTVLVDQPGH